MEAIRAMRRLNKPEYVFRPGQMIRRLAHAFLPEPEEATITLPWGLQMRVRPHEDLGRAIWQLGVYDLPLAEAVWRLMEPGDTGVDAGANIGYVTGLMAARSGPTGHIFSYEPHPKIFDILVSHVGSWEHQQIACITPSQLALSSKAGHASLEEPDGFQRNPGIARIVTREASHITIATARLDDIIREGPVGLLKLDVEGHEFEVLSGSRRLLENHAIRDIIFEEHTCSFTSAVPSFLATFGYEIFGLTRTFSRPSLVAAGGRHVPVFYLSPSFLATQRPERARAKFAAAGWQVLRPNRFKSRFSCRWDNRESIDPAPSREVGSGA